MERIRVFKTKIFAKWAREEGLSDGALVKTVEEMQHGLYEANLGAGIYKKRIAIGSRGKSGGLRVIAAFKLNALSIFIYGFAKNERDNITEKEKRWLKALAKVYFSYGQTQIDKAKKTGELIEVVT